MNPTEINKQRAEIIHLAIEVRAIVGKMTEAALKAIDSAWEPEDAEETEEDHTTCDLTAAQNRLREMVDEWRYSPETLDASSCLNCVHNGGEDQCHVGETPQLVNDAVDHFKQLRCSQWRQKGDN